MNPIYKYLLVAAALIALGFAGGYKWRDGDYQQLRADTANEAKQQAELLTDETNKRVAAEQALIRKNYELDIANQKVRNNVSTKIATLHSDVSNRAVRLSVPTSSCAPTANATPSIASQPATETRAELLPEFANRLIDRAASCDNEVRERNEIIDRYNNAKDALTQFQSQL